MKKSQSFTVTELISSLLIFIIGIILITKSSMVINLLSWVLGGILVVIGIIKVIFYSCNKKNNIDSSSLISGILMVAGGSILLIFPNIIDITIRIIFGGWILFTGINRLVFAFAIYNIDRNGFKTFLITSIIMVISGILILISFYELIGVLLVIYSVAEIVNYIYFNCKKENYSSVYNYDEKGKDNRKQKQIKQEIKEKEAIDAVIDQ